LGRGADLAAWIERTALEAADAVVAVSQDMKGDILRHFCVAPERIHVIHNGIDTEEYRPVRDCQRLRKYGIDAECPYVLFIGRASRQKGIVHLVNAIPQIDREAQVVLCAGAPDTPEIAQELEDAVRRVVTTRGHVVWIRDMVDRPTAIELYSHAAVFCCPSLYEPFGIINLEAMACETPVVASAVGGIPEVVVHGETGLLVPVERQANSSFEPADPAQFSHDLATSINALLADGALRKAMGKKGRQRCEAHFSWAAITKKVLALYEVLVRPPERLSA
jgi:glycogen synthase